MKNKQMVRKGTQVVYGQYPPNHPANNIVAQKKVIKPADQKRNTSNLRGAIKTIDQSYKQPRGSRNESDKGFSLTTPNLQAVDYGSTDQISATTGPGTTMAAGPGMMKSGSSTGYSSTSKVGNRLNKA